MKTSNTSDTVMGAIGGVATGYVLWLLAISIGDDVTTVSRWSLVVLVAVGCVGALRRGVGLVAAPARQVSLGGVCVRPADTPRGADVGRAGRYRQCLRVTGARVVQRDVEGD